MMVQIGLDNKYYNNFSEIMRLNEEEEYTLEIDVLKNDGSQYSFTGKTISANLRLVNTVDVTDAFNVNATVVDLATGIFNVSLKDAFTNKGGKAYFVYWQLNNQTDNLQFNIYCGRLIIDKKL